MEDAESKLVRAAKIKTRQKPPAIAINPSEYRLIVWGEAFGFSKGGTLNMQLFTHQNELQSITG